MGQPTHPLMLHAGKSQLWTWGASVTPKEAVYAWQTRKTLVGVRYILAFLGNLLIVHTAHLWAPRNWFGGGLARQRLFLKASALLHMPNLTRRRIRRRYFRFTPRKLGFLDGDQAFYEFAMDRRWSFFRPYAWGQVHVFRFGLYVVICVGGVPLQNAPLNSKRQLRNRHRSNRLLTAVNTRILNFWF